jgi:hypothetical protein
MHLDKWLEQMVEEEQVKTAGIDLDRVFNQLEPDELLKIACGEQDLETVLEERQKTASFLGLAKKNPGVERLNQAFDSYEKRTGKSRKTMSTKDILDEVNKSKTAAPVVPDKNADAMQKLAFVDSVARQIAHVHTEVEKEAGSKNVRRQLTKMYERYGSSALASEPQRRAASRGAAKIHGWMGEKGLGREARKVSRGMVKEDEFTSPEAKAKAKIMSSALKASKGAPTKVRKAAVSVAGEQVQKVAAMHKEAVGDTAEGQKKLRALGQRLAQAKQETAAAGLSGKIQGRKALGKGVELTKRIGRVMARLR